MFMFGVRGRVVELYNTTSPIGLFDTSPSILHFEKVFLSTATALLKMSPISDPRRS